MLEMTVQQKLKLVRPEISGSGFKPIIGSGDVASPDCATTSKDFSRFMPFAIENSCSHIARSPTGPRLTATQNAWQQLQGLGCLVRICWGQILLK